MAGASARVAEWMVKVVMRFIIAVDVVACDAPCAVHSEHALEAQPDLMHEHLFGMGVGDRRNATDGAPRYVTLITQRFLLDRPARLGR